MNHSIIKAYLEMNKSQKNPEHITPTPVEEVQAEIAKLKQRSKELDASGLYDNEPIILTGKEQKSKLRLFATEIMCDMLTNLLNLKNGVNSNSSNLNYDLEIHHDGNLILTDNIINNNISLLRENLERSFKYVIRQEDLQILTILENTADRKAMIPIYERLLSFYISESLTCHTEDENIDIMNKCIKMLLECEVKGIYQKEKITTI